MLVGVGNNATVEDAGNSNTMIAPKRMITNIKIDSNNNIGDCRSINSDSIADDPSKLDFAAVSTTPANGLSTGSSSCMLSSDEERLDDDAGNGDLNSAPHIKHWLASGTTTLSQFGQRWEAFSWGGSIGVTSDLLVI